MHGCASRGRMDTGKASSKLVRSPRVMTLCDIGDAKESARTLCDYGDAKERSPEIERSTRER